jgi:hypothetical protein
MFKIQIIRLVEVQPQEMPPKRCLSLVKETAHCFRA